jgi:hypothetical protein
LDGEAKKGDAEEAKSRLVAEVDASRGTAQFSKYPNLGLSARLELHTSVHPSALGKACSGTAVAC